MNLYRKNSTLCNVEIVGWVKKLTRKIRVLLRSWQKTVVQDGDSDLHAHCRKPEHHNFNLKGSAETIDRDLPGKTATSCFVLISEYETVHGRILAVNMAHLRKKRETASIGAQSGGTVFHRIEETNNGTCQAKKFIFHISSKFKCHTSAESSRNCFFALTRN